VFRALSPAARALLNHPLDAGRWPLGEAWCSRRATHGAYCRQHREAARRPAVVPDGAEVEGDAKSPKWAFWKFPDRKSNAQSGHLILPRQKAQSALIADPRTHLGNPG
jgi:hypothetical protein